MIVEKISMAIATQLHERSSDKDSHTIGKLNYGLQIILNFTLVFALLIMSSLILHIFVKTMILFLMIALLRQMSGGIHLKSSELCTIVSVLSIIIIVKYSHYINVNYLDFISLFILILYAPATFKVRIEKRKKAFIIMKFISITIILINLTILKYDYISIAFIIQSLSVGFEHYKLRKEVRQ